MGKLEKNEVMISKGSLNRWDGNKNGIQRANAVLVDQLSHYCRRCGSLGDILCAKNEANT